MRNRLFQFSIASCLVFTAIVAAIFAFGPNFRAYVATQELLNADIEVNGNPFGLFVFIESESAATLRQLGAASNRSLLASLEDPERFAAAHQLLTEINPDRFQSASPYWGSDMDPFGTASSDFDEDLIPVLVDFWQKALTEPQGFSEDERRLDFDFSTTAQYEIGDLVPCDAEKANFELLIGAWSSGRCFYEYSQPFCHHVGESTNPIEQPGLTPKQTVCSLLDNGTMTGSLQYSKFSKDSVTVKVEWSVTLDGDEEYFRREFDVFVDGDGLVHAGKGNRFKWVFRRPRDETE